MGSNPVYSKSVKSVSTNKKLSHFSSLLQYNYLTKKTIIYFSLQKFSSTEIVPPHPPSSTLHMRMLNAAT